jgi:hypothetical protein
MTINRHLQEILKTALWYCYDNEFARVCIKEARKYIEQEDFKKAELRLKESLQCSIGICHPEYLRLFIDD